MDRNRDARKSTVAASANGLSRRRHRSSSLRDSPEEDGPMELQETARLRDRGLKKDLDRDRSSRSKRRRGDRLNGGEESSEESVNDDEEDDYDDERGGGAGGGGGGVVRMFPPPNPTSLVPSSLSNHHYANRKSYPPAVAAKVLRPAAPGWKPADEVIGFTVPRKARSASGKRSQECSISGSGVVADQINRQTSTSPVRLTPSPSPVSPPSSSNASVRKKMKPNGSKPRPPKSTSKPSSSSPEELEIEIAEVLYGMSSSKKEITGNHSANLDLREMNNKSRVSSPISNPTSQLPQNSSSSAAPVSAVAPKRKRPRQVSDNLGNSSVRHIPISSTTVTKVEVDLAPKKEISSPNMGSVAENGSVPRDFASSQVGPPPSEPPPPDSCRSESLWETRDVGQAEDEAVTSPKKESPMVRTDNDRELATVTKADPTISAIESQREEKFEIDLMAPPPQTRSSPEREGEINFAAALVQKPLTTDKEDENAVKSGKEEAINVEPEPKKVKVTQEEAESEKKPVVNKERNIDLQLDLEKQERDISVSSNKLNPEVQKPQQQQQQPKAIKDEPQPTEKIAQSGSLPLPMSVASWPGGLPPMGYMAPFQGVVSMDGNTVSPTPIPPLFSHPRPKRCATHFYIARNIHYLQQFMKMNPFWPPSAGPAASMFGGKPCNLNVLPSAELHGNNAGRNVNSLQEKGQGLAIFSGHSGKDKGAQATNIPDAQRKQQQILLQQALPPGAPSNILHGPAFIFPLNHQQAAAAAAAASIRPGSVKPPTSGNVAATSASTSASVSGSTTAPPAGTAVTFNYPNMPASETQYLAILQNNPYPFPIPSVGAPPTYRGTHAQAMPFFNGSFYSSQMMHPSQLQQQQQQPPTQPQNTSSSSSSSQKHLHQQQQQQQQHQRQQGSSGSNLHSFPAQKKANQHMPNAEVGGEDSPSTADSRVSRASMGVYSQNFAAVPMPIHPQNYALMTHPPPSTLGGASGGGGNQGEKKQQQGLKAGLESMSPQTFAMSFGSMNGVDMSVAQNHAVLQSVEATRQSFQMMAAATDAAQVGLQKKNFRVSEEGKNAAAVACDSSNNIDEEKKSSALKPPTVGQQSIVFSRTDLPESVSSPLLRAQRPAIPMMQQYHQQQMMQLHKHQQQQQQQQVAAAAAAARNKTPPTSNGSVYSDHLASSAKYPNGISNFPQNLVQNSSGSPSQSPQWKNPMKPTSQVPSTTSSLKNLPQQQTRTQHNQTQISFAGAQKPATAPPQGQQAATSHQAPSPPMAVGSPTTSSISKGASGSPRTTTTSASAGTKSAQPSTLSSQPSKNSASVGSRNVSSVLGNSHVASFSNTSVKSQMQQQQQQMFLPHAYLQPQASNQPFFLQRRRLEQQPQGSSTTSSSTGMMSLCSPVQGSNASNSDAKAVAASAASAAASNLKGGGLLSQGIPHSAVPPGFSYVHAVPSPGQLKPAEQKQPTGNRDGLTKK